MRLMTWRTMGLADIACHVKGCHLTQETRVYNVEDDVAGIVCQALVRGGRGTPRDSWRTSDPAVRANPPRWHADGRRGGCESYDEFGADCGEPSEVHEGNGRAVQVETRLTLG